MCECEALPIGSQSVRSLAGGHVGVLRQTADGGGEVLGVSRGHDGAAIDFENEPRDFALGMTDKEHRLPRGGDAVKLARYDEALELRKQGDEVNVPDSEAESQRLARLIVHEHKVTKLPPADFFHQQRFAVAPSDEEECDAAVAQQFGCAENRLELVNAAHVSRVHHDKAVREPPAGA